MASPRRSTTHAALLLLLACVALALCSAETFPRSAADRPAVVAPVAAAHTEDLEPQTLSGSSSSSSSSSSTASSAASSSSSAASSDAAELSQFLRGSSGSFGSRGSSSSSSGAVTVESELLPSGGNGFGRVTYDDDDDARSKLAASALGGMRSGESQAAYRARIRKAQRAAERKNPDLRLQNLVAF